MLCAKKEECVQWQQWAAGIDDGRLSMAAQNEREVEDEFGFHVQF
jgi:hypothetical protein